METLKVIHLTVLGESLSSVCRTLYVMKHASSLVLKKTECKCDNVLLFFSGTKKMEYF